MVLYSLRLAVGRVVTRLLELVDDFAVKPYLMLEGQGEVTLP